MREKQSTHLFGLQGQLDKDLLQLLVDEVDAELLETVLLEDLKPVDVQDPEGQEAGLFMASLNLHGLVHSLKTRAQSKVA